MPQIKHFYELFYEYNIKRWEQNSLGILTASNVLFVPIMFYHSYKGLDNKMNSFLKRYSQVAEMLEGNQMILCETGYGHNFISDNTYKIFKKIYWKIFFIYCMDIIVAITFASFFSLLLLSNFASYTVIVSSVGVIMTDLMVYFPFITASESFAYIKKLNMY